ncbi:MAG: 2-oxoacid:ferredoxin oxidoreductase subunit gamma [Ruminococcaceae bacterium]|nr:2-oxoacid:ferredoxin oxidoreductase subunit gamma [Oscillospiraceae bacterium]
MVKNIIFAGFGGQGVLFAGKVTAYAGLSQGYEVSWLPSYGPEMRGGTANCSVVIADRPIGSPLVINPDVLIAMNKPSFEKFAPLVASGGIIIYDSSLIDSKCDRDDIEIYDINATELSQSENLKGLSNMILLGKAMKVVGILKDKSIEEGLVKSVPPRKSELLKHNMRAIELGKNN